MSTQNVTKRWKKKLKHVRLKIKRKDQESDNMNAAQVTHKWKSQMNRSKERNGGEMDGQGVENDEFEAERRRRKRRPKEREGAELADTVDVLKVSHNWRRKTMKRPIEEEEEAGPED